MRWFTRRQEFVRCGRKDCESCPHGPYWYQQYIDAKGRRRKKYLAKVQPQDYDMAAYADRVVRGLLVSPWVLYAICGAKVGVSRKAVGTSARAAMRALARRGAAPDDRRIVAIRLAFERIRKLVIG